MTALVRNRSAQAVHSRLYRARGPAKAQPCAVCGGTARDWAYLYTAGDAEIVQPGGSRYSDDLDDYAPMCRRCHRRFDATNDPERATGRGVSRNAKMYRCGGCPTTANAGGLATHHKHTGHEGREDA